jgi:hypothetical protein
MTALLDGMFGELFGGGRPEPPDTIPLRILGLHQLPAEPDTIRQAFRTRMLAAHPDLRDGAETADANADVAELVWARDVLLRKVPAPVTPDKGPSCPGFSGNGSPVTPDEVSACNRISRHDYRCENCKDERLNYFGEPYRKHWHGRWSGYCWACAADAENARIRERRAQARTDRTCENCGATFMPRRADGR